MDHNRQTLKTYQRNVPRFAATTEQADDPALAPNWQWVDAALDLLPNKQASILEIGSGTGRDAQYMEDRGFTVSRTDAVQGFVDLLVRQDHTALLLNVLDDTIPGHRISYSLMQCFLTSTATSYQEYFKNAMALWPPEDYSHSAASWVMAKES